MKYCIQWASIFVILLNFTACANKHYDTTKTVMLSIKTPPLKFSDQAYFRHDEDSLQIELFSAGVAVEKFEVQNLICTNSGCMQKSHFNDKYLSQHYETTFLENVLQGKAIFNAQGKVNTSDGFTQIIKMKNKYNITYKVTSSSVYFKDIYNNLLIKMRYLN